MDRYIQQLIEDLEAAAQNLPKPLYYENLPVFGNDLALAQLAMVTVTTLEELTGISIDAFPGHDRIDGRHCRAVLEAIFEVLGSLGIELIDVPRGIPKEWLYETITSNWQCEVQYFPLTGMDLELCSGDIMTCPYGDYCDCGHEWPDDEEFFEIDREIPKRYHEHIPKMAEAIDKGNVCFLYEDTLEMKTIPLSVYEDPEAFGALVGNGGDDENCVIDISREKFMAEPLMKFEIDDMMEDFARRIDKGALQNRLFNALNSKNRFEGFDYIVLNSMEKQNWLAFKQNWLERHVNDTIWQDIKNSYDFPEDSICESYMKI